MWGGVYSKGAFQAEELAGASNGVGEWHRRAAGGAVELETPAGAGEGRPGLALESRTPLLCLSGRLSQVWATPVPA